MPPFSHQPTHDRGNDTLTTQSPFFSVICSNSCTRIVHRCPPSYASMTLKVIDGIWYNISRTQQELYPEWRLVQLGISHITCTCTTMQSHSIDGLWVLQTEWCFLLSFLCRQVLLGRIHYMVKVHFWSNHLTNLLVLDNHHCGIQLARNLPYSLYWQYLPSLSSAWTVECRYNSLCCNDTVLGPWWWRQRWQ